MRKLLKCNFQSVQTETLKLWTAREGCGFALSGHLYCIATHTVIWRIISPIFADDYGLPVFKALVWSERLNTELRSMASRG